MDTLRGQLTESHSKVDALTADFQIIQIAAAHTKQEAKELQDTLDEAKASVIANEAAAKAANEELERRLSEVVVLKAERDKLALEYAGVCVCTLFEWTVRICIYIYIYGVR